MPDPSRASTQNLNSSFLEYRLKFTLLTFYLRIMHYVYVLQSKVDSDLYIGCTNDLKKRLEMHNAKKILSTAKRAPFDIIYYEALIDSHDTFEREKFFKTGWGRTSLRKILRN